MRKVWPRGHLRGGDTRIRKAPGSMLWARARETLKAAPGQEQGPAGPGGGRGKGRGERRHTRFRKRRHMSEAQRWAGTLGRELSGGRAQGSSWGLAVVHPRDSLGHVALGCHLPRQERELSGFHYEERTGERMEKMAAEEWPSSCTEEGGSLSLQPGGSPGARSEEGPPTQAGCPECGCSPHLQLPSGKGRLCKLDGGRPQWPKPHPHGGWAPGLFSAGKRPFLAGGPSVPLSPGLPGPVRVWLGCPLGLQQPALWPLPGAGCGQLGPGLLMPKLG